MSDHETVVRCDVADCIAPAVRIAYRNDDGGTSRPVYVCATHDPRHGDNDD